MAEETWDRPDRWVWMDEPPTVEEAMDLLSKLDPVYGVKTADYAEFVLPMKNNQKYEDEKGVTRYRPTFRLYMQVAGRVKMLEHAADRNKWIIDEDQVFVEGASPAVIRINTAIFLRESDAFPKLGNRWGISKLKGGDSAWEKAETAARGRSLGAWGFGVLPGSGLASLDEMMEVRDADVGGETRQEPMTKDELLEAVMTSIEELRVARNEDPARLYTKLALYVSDHMGAKVDAGPPLDLSPLKPGQLQLLLRNVRAQLQQELRAESPY